MVIWMDNSERFLNLYRDLEEVLGVKYQIRSGAIQHFGAREGARWQEELNLFREMRNLLSHHGKIEKQAPMQPSEPSIRILEEILEYAKHPPAALSIATLTDQLYCADGSELVTDLLEEMEQRGFSHIPVVDEKRRLTGVFSVGSVFAHTRSRPDQPVAGLRVRDMEAVLPPQRHIMEKFYFVDKDASCYEIKKLFQKSDAGSRRVAAVFVTVGGNEKSPIMGMITPWDVLRAEK